MTDFLPRLHKALEARGKTAAAVSRDAGHKGIIGNWDYKGQDPSIGRLKTVCDAIPVSPAWVAYGDDPQPVPPPNGFTATPQKLDQPDNALGALYAAWKADDGQLEARFFDALEMTGLLPWTYILKERDGELYYHFIGTGSIKALGWCWWVEAQGKRVADDPDQAFASWSLERWYAAMQREQPFRDRCLVVSRYKPFPQGWEYDTLVVPIEGGLIVVNEVV